MAVNPKINLEALKSDIRAALINKKSFACPIAARVAWHAAGTYDKNDGSGGSDGATMRFEPEASDPANAGLIIVRDMLHEVKKKYPEISEADLWTLAGSVAIEFMGGPKVPHRFGRSDAADGAKCPAHGRLPDASQGADHLREVFYRMGFDDREIVALSGAHTVGRAHQVRSGYDGPWTQNPLVFDNSYFKNLIELEWRVRDWDGNLQYEDVATGTLMMLPTDIALRDDPAFRVHVERYAADQQAFFDDFAAAYSKLLALGCPPECDPSAPCDATDDARAEKSALFRDYAMHGSVGHMRKLVAEGQVDVHEVEASSGRSALHKAAFWGHIGAVRYLVTECGLDVDVQDHDGDTALHDAARFGHLECVEALLEAGANTSLKNAAGMDALAVAIELDKPDVVAALRRRTAATLTLEPA